MDGPTNVHVPRVWRYLNLDTKSNTKRSMHRGCLTLRHGKESLLVHVDALINASRLVANLFEADPNLKEVVVPTRISAESLDWFLTIFVYQKVTSCREVQAATSCIAASFFDSPDYVANLADWATYRRMNAIIGYGQILWPNSDHSSVNILDLLLSVQDEMAYYFPNSWRLFLNAQVYLITKYDGPESILRSKETIHEMRQMAAVEGQTWGVNEGAFDLRLLIAHDSRRELRLKLQMLDPTVSPRCTIEYVEDQLCRWENLVVIRDLLDRATDGRWIFFDALGSEIARTAFLTPGPDRVSFSWRCAIRRNGNCVCEGFFDEAIIPKVVAVYMKIRFDLDVKRVYTTLNKAREWRARFMSLFILASPMLRDLSS